MTNKRVLAGMAALGGLGLLAFVGALASWWWLVVAGIAGMTGVIGVVALNTNLLIRAHRKEFDRFGRSAGPVNAAAGAGSAATSQTSAADIAGTMRLLQAQYVGRLDRAQSALERAAATLTGAAGAAGGPATEDRSPFAGLPHGATVLLHHIDAHTLAHARDALSRGFDVHAVVADSADRERLEAAGLGDSVTMVADAGDAGHALTVILPGLDT